MPKETSKNRAAARNRNQSPYVPKAGPDTTKSRHILNLLECRILKRLLNHQRRLRKSPRMYAAHPQIPRTHPPPMQISFWSNLRSVLAAKALTLKMALHQRPKPTQSRESPMLRPNRHRRRSRLGNQKGGLQAAVGVQKLARRSRR